MLQTRRKFIVERVSNGYVFIEREIGEERNWSANGVVTADQNKILNEWRKVFTDDEFEKLINELIELLSPMDYPQVYHATTDEETKGE